MVYKNKRLYGLQPIQNGNSGFYSLSNQYQRIVIERKKLQLTKLKIKIKSFS